MSRPQETILSCGLHTLPARAGVHPPHTHAKSISGAHKSQSSKAQETETLSALQAKVLKNLS